MKHPDYISASEIAEYLYCQRAWWYRLRRVVSANKPVMEQGVEQHDDLVEAVQNAEAARKLGRRLVLAGGVLLLILLVLRLLATSWMP